MIHRNLRALCERLLILPALVLCIGSPGAFAAAVGGGTYYVSGAGDDAAGDGSEANPWRTITHAVSQAEGGSGTVMVGAGLYDELAGESFPIDLAPDSGITFTGPGDGSALISTNWESVFEIPDSLAEYEIRGLDFEGAAANGVLGGSEAVVYTTDTELPASLKMEDNNLTGIALANLNGHETGIDYVTNSQLMFRNNTISNVYFGVNISAGFSTTGQVSFVIEGNTFVDVSYPCYIRYNNYNPMTVNGLVAGNVMEDCESGFVNDAYRIDDHFSINLAVLDNAIDANSCGIKLETMNGGWGPPDPYNADVLISGNEVQGGDFGIMLDFFAGDAGGNLVEDTGAIIDRDVLISNNQVLGADLLGIGAYTHISGTGYVAEHAISVVGNTIVGDDSEYGLEFGLWHSGSGQSSSYVVEALNNHVAGFNVPVWMATSFTDSDYLSMGSTSSGAPVKRSVSYRGNVIESDLENLGYYDHPFLLFWECNIFDPNETELNFGDHEGYGFNTIRLDFENGRSDTVFLPHGDAAVASFVGNWWGTTDPLEIEQYVHHGVDDPYLQVVDLSNPLPDSLDFTAEYQDGVGLVVTAGADAGFVAYAGDLIMMGSITGPEPGSGEIEASWVSEDYQTLTLPDPTGMAPAGDYEICLTNPGGQSGCASFTVGGDDDEDCSQNQIPTAVSDNVSTAQATSVLIDLTANDSDHNGNMDPTAVTITQDPSKGTVVNHGDGTATYTPDEEHEQTTDTFNYTVSDTCGAISNIASCHIIIGGGDGGGGGGDNQIPTAVYDAAVTEMGASVDIDILSNDSDSDGDALDTGSVVITQDPGKGSVVVNADGTVSYTPSEGVAGTTDTFNYTVDDEHGATSNIATVAVSIGFGSDSEEASGGVSGEAGRTGAPGVRGGLGNTGTVNHGTRTP